MKIFINRLFENFDTFRLKMISKSFINLISRRNYAHDLYWFDTKIFQTPTDLYLYQNLLFKVKPTTVIETGVAEGGSILFTCHILDLIHGKNKRNSWQIICCDINSMANAKRKIIRHGYSKNVKFFKGDSSKIEFNNFVKKNLRLKKQKAILVSLDSNHTENHVFQELNSLSNFVSKNSFIIVWDSRIGDLSILTHLLRKRAWKKKSHAGTAVLKFLGQDSAENFKIEKNLENKLLITGTKFGILRKQS